MTVPAEGNGRLIVVSNRLPVSLSKEEGVWTAKRSSGGLATAMDPILRQQGGVWIGWSGAPDQTAETVEVLRREHGCEAVDLPADIAALFYEGYSNESLWPLFHSYPDRFRFAPEAWSAYQEANRRFCDTVADHYQPGDRIWVHDYHLMLLPGLLRERIPEAPIGFFLHIPFPASDIFGLLPRGEEVLRGVLGADLVAFHTHFHLQHFRRSVRRMLALESKVDSMQLAGRDVHFRALPIGIAPQEFISQLSEPDTLSQIETLRSAYQGRKLVVSVDRLDYTKGLPERLRTWKRLLTTNPTLKEQVVLLQVAVPSRENIDTYQGLTDEVHKLVSEINGEFGTASWTPVVYLHRGISRSELVALYSFADVAWVSPLRDGMNLVAKEFVACKPGHDGVLVLSAFAGAAAEMGEAMLVNPYDEERTADTLVQAMALSPDEQRARMSALHQRVIRNDVFAWGERFLTALDEAVSSRSERRDGTPQPLQDAELVDAFASAAHRIIFLNYDGTLVPLAASSQDPAPDPELLEVLAKLASSNETQLILLSGRTIADLERWFGNVRGIWLAAEHGARWRAPEEQSWNYPAKVPEWKDTVRPIFAHFTDRIPGSYVEEKEFALTWNYQMTEPEFGEWLAMELTAMLDGMLAETELQVHRGSKTVEVRPMAANKGAFASRFLQEAHENAGFILAIGDDRTDEDLFTRIPSHGWTVHVGDGESRASHNLPHPAGVRALLSRLVSSSRVHA